MTEEILEPVEMVCWFRGGEVVPCRFRWNGTVHRVERVTSRWESRSGVYRSLHYMVNTRSGDAYEIHLDMENTRWMLDYRYGEA